MIFFPTIMSSTDKHGRYFNPPPPPQYILCRRLRGSRSVVPRRREQFVTAEWAKRTLGHPRCYGKIRFGLEYRAARATDDYYYRSWYHPGEKAIWTGKKLDPFTLLLRGRARWPQEQWSITTVVACGVHEYPLLPSDVSDWSPSALATYILWEQCSVPPRGGARGQPSNAS